MLHSRLVKLRKDRGMTQQQLSDILHISRGTYAQYEIGRRTPDYDILHKLADFFEVSTDYLLGRTNTPILQNTKGTFIETELSPENTEELKKFAELLKIKQMTENNKKNNNESRYASGTDKL